MAQVRHREDLLGCRGGALRVVHSVLISKIEYLRSARDQPRGGRSGCSAIGSRAGNSNWVARSFGGRAADHLLDIGESVGCTVRGLRRLDLGVATDGDRPFVIGPGGGHRADLQGRFAVRNRGNRLPPASYPMQDRRLLVFAYPTFRQSFIACATNAYQGIRTLSPGLPRRHQSSRQPGTHRQRAPPRHRRRLRLDTPATFALIEKKSILLLGANYMPCASTLLIDPIHDTNLGISGLSNVRGYVYMWGGSEGYCVLIV